MTVVGWENRTEVSRDVIVDAGRDEVGIVALHYDAAKLVGLRKMSPIFRIELRCNEGSSHQGHLTSESHHRYCGADLLSGDLRFWRGGKFRRLVKPVGESEIHCLQWLLPQDHVRRLFGNHVHGGGGVG